MFQSVADTTTVWQGELSTLERAKITTDGTAEQRCCTANLAHPTGVFPLNGTNTESHSKKTFKAYRDFKKHAAEDVLKEPLSDAIHLEVRPLEIDWPPGEMNEHEWKRHMSHGVVYSKHWLEFKKQKTNAADGECCDLAAQTNPLAKKPKGNTDMRHEEIAPSKDQLNNPISTSSVPVTKEDTGVNLSNENNQMQAAFINRATTKEAARAARSPMRGEPVDSPSAVVI